MSAEKQIVSELQGLKGLIANSIGAIIDAETQEIQLLTDLVGFMKSNAKKQAASGKDKGDKGGKGILKGISFKELSDNIGSFSKGLLIFAKAAAKGAPRDFTRFMTDLQNVMTQGGTMTSPKQITALYGAMGDAIKSFAGSLSGFARGLLWFMIPAKLGAGDLFITFISKLFSPKVMQKLDTKKAAEAGEALRLLGVGIRTFALSLALATLAMIVGGPGLIIIVPAIMLVFGVFARFSKNMDQIKEGAEAVKQLSIGLLIFTATLILVRFVRAEDLLMAMGVIGVFLLFVAGLALISKLMGGMSNMKDAAVSVMWMSAGLAVFALATMIMRFVEWEDLLKTTVVVGVMGLMVYIMGESKDARNGAVAFFVISVSLILVALAVKMFEPIEWDTIGKMIACLAGVTLAVYVVGQNLKSALEGAFGVLIVSASMIVLGFAAGYWQSLNIQDETLIQMGLALAGITVALVALGLVGPAVILGAAALALVAVSFAGSIWILSDAIGKFKAVGWTKEDTDAFTLALTELPSAMASGFWSGGGPLLILAAGGLAATALAMYPMIRALDDFKKSGITSDIALEAGAVVGGFIEAVRAPIEAVGKGGGLFKKSEFAKGIDAIDGLGSTVAEIAEGVLAASRMEFKSLDGSIVKVPPSAFVTVGQNVSAMINALKEPIMEIGRNSKPPESTGLLGALGLGMLLPDDNDFRQGMKAIHGLGGLISEIAQGVLDMVKLEFKSLDGTIVKIKPQDYTTVGTNITNLINSLKAPIIEIGSMSKPVEIGGPLGWLTGGLIGAILPDENDFTKGMQAISGLGGLIAEIAGAVLKMMSLEFKSLDGSIVKVTSADFVTVGQNVSAMINALKAPIIEIGNMSTPKDVGGGPLGWLFGDLVSAILPMDNAFQQGMESVGGLGALVSGLAEGVKTFGGGEFPDPDNPKGPKVNALAIAPRVGTVVGALITSLMEPIGKFGKQAEKREVTGPLGWLFGDIVESWFPRDNEFQRGMEAVGGLGGLMSGIAKAVDTFGSGYIPDPRDPEGKTFIDVNTVVPKMVRTFGSILEGMQSSIAQYAEMDTDDTEDAETNVTRVTNFIKQLSTATQQAGAAVGIYLKYPDLDFYLRQVAKAMKAPINDIATNAGIFMTARRNMDLAVSFFEGMKSSTVKMTWIDYYMKKYKTMPKNVPAAAKLMNTALLNIAEGGALQQVAPYVKTFDNIADSMVKIARNAGGLSSAARSMKSISESLVKVLTSLDSVMTDKLLAMAKMLDKVTQINQVNAVELEKKVEMYVKFAESVKNIDDTTIEKMQRISDAQFGGMKEVFEKFQGTLDRIATNTGTTSGHLEKIASKKWGE